MSDHDPLMISRHELEEICRKMSREGVQEALATLGLNDPKDIYEIKSIVDAWRQIRTSAFQTVGRLVTTFILAAIVAYVVIQNKWFS